MNENDNCHSLSLLSLLSHSLSPIHTQGGISFSRQLSAVPPPEKLSKRAQARRFSLVYVEFQHIAEYLPRVKGSRSLQIIFVQSVYSDRKELEKLCRSSIWTKKFARVASFYETCQKSGPSVVHNTTVAIFSFWVSRSALSGNRLSMA